MLKYLLNTMRDGHCNQRAYEMSSDRLFDYYDTDLRKNFHTSTTNRWWGDGGI